MNGIAFQGHGLNRQPDTGDAVKFVTSSITAASDCDSVAAISGAGTEQTDLKPDDHHPSSTAYVEVAFNVGGTFNVCYKVAGGGYVVPGQTITVNGPSSVTASRRLVEASSADCSGASDAAPIEVTDLGPGDASGQVSATATVTFTTPGDYKVCYK